MDKIGRIYGEVIGQRFVFASKDYFEGNYVKIAIGEQTDTNAEIIGEIVSRGISNRYLSTPEVVKYLDDRMDFQRDTIYTYTVNCMGIIKDGKLVNGRMNGIPGQNVYPADIDVVKVVYGINGNGPIVGYLKEMPDCSVNLDPDQIFNPHLFIVGKTGSGKSYFIKNFIAKIIDEVWVFAPTDEYNDIDAKIKKHTEFILDLNIDSIGFYIGLNVSEELILRNVDFDKNKIYSNKDIIAEIYKYYERKNDKGGRQLTLDFGEEMTHEIELPGYANSLIAKLKSIRHIKFSGNTKTIQVPRSSAVFDMSNYSQLEQECILNFYLYRLLQRCKKTKTEKRKKHIIVIEEAHNYVPSIKNTISKDIVVRLSREGRKYGISLCFVTQRPRLFDQTALSQSGNKIIFSLPNPDDVKHIMEDIAFYKPELATKVLGQKRGECVIAGDAFNDVLEIVVQY